MFKLPIIPALWGATNIPRQDGLKRPNKRETGTSAGAGEAPAHEGVAVQVQHPLELHEFEEVQLEELRVGEVSLTDAQRRVARQRHGVPEQPHLVVEPREEPGVYPRTPLDRRGRPCQ